MKTLAAFSLALAMTASGTLLRAQDQPGGPSTFKAGENVSGEITKIDMATKTIVVKPSTGTPGANATIEYQAKDSTDLAKFHVGDMVSGKVSKDNPPKLTNLKASSERKSPAGGAGMGAGAGAGAAGGGMGAPGDTSRAPGAPR